MEWRDICDDIIMPKLREKVAELHDVNPDDITAEMMGGWHMFLSDSMCSNVTNDVFSEGDSSWEYLEKDGRKVFTIPIIFSEAIENNKVMLMRDPFRHITIEIVGG